MGHFEGMNADQVLDAVEDLLTKLDEAVLDLSLLRIKTKLTQNLRRELIIKLLEVPELITQADIAKRTGLSRQAISLINRELIVTAELDRQLERISRLKEQ